MCHSSCFLFFAPSLPSFQDVLWNFANHKSRKLLLETTAVSVRFFAFGSSSASKPASCVQHVTVYSSKRLQKEKNQKQRKCEREERKRKKKIGGWDSILIMRNLPRDLHRPRIHYIECWRRQKGKAITNSLHGSLSCCCCYWALRACATGRT